MTQTPNEDQRAFWSDQAGHKWVAQQQVMDALLGPVLDGVLDRADIQTGHHVLDIGCGAGTSTLRAGKLAGPTGIVVGADISDTLLALGRDRSKDMQGVSYIHADAATHMFAPQSFDRLISRFGVMFFDGTTAAFSNIVKGLKVDAHVSMATWGAIEANPYFKLAAKAARDVLGAMPKTDPDAPGPFAMRDPDRVVPMLRDAGLKEIHADRQKIFLTPQGDLHAFADICMAIGPAEGAIRHFEATPDQIEQVHASLTQTFKPFQRDDGSVKIPAEIIFYTARP